MTLAEATTWAVVWLGVYTAGLAIIGHAHHWWGAWLVVTELGTLVLVRHAWARWVVPAADGRRPGGRPLERQSRPGLR